MALAEDALCDAFAAALSTWPKQGAPANPEAWLMQAARRRVIDAVRRGRTRAAGAETLLAVTDPFAGADNNREIPDERLRLIFACAHPAIEAVMRAPLILQTVLGLEAAQIASAFLVRPAAMAQRLVRAKVKIRDAGIPFAIPEREEMPARLESVLEAIYAVFTQGWADPAGADARSRGLTEEALWLGRLLTVILPDEPEALGLLALMLHADARRAARRDAQGGFVALDAQDTALWDAALIGEAEQAILRAATMGRPGRFQIEAAIQSAHAHRRISGRTDWGAVAGFYDLLWRSTGSAVVAVNRAVAVGRRDGPQAGLALLAPLQEDQRMSGYQPYWAGRADLLARIGRIAEADAAYERAIGLETDPALRRYLAGQRAALH